MPFWLAFIFRCARSSGLREAASHELESGLNEFLPPDSLSGAKEESRKGKELRETYFRYCNFLMKMLTETIFCRNAMLYFPLAGYLLTKDLTS